MDRLADVLLLILLWLIGLKCVWTNWSFVPPCPSKLGKDLAYPACWCVFFVFDVFELFLNGSKLQWCVVEFQELWWDRHHWWQPMKATTLKQTVWTWMVRLPDSLCKHQQESELLWLLFLTLLLCVSVVQPPTEEIAQFHTIPVCALCEALTEWIQSGIGMIADGISHPLTESEHSESITPYVGVSHPPPPHWGRGVTALRGASISMQHRHWLFRWLLIIDLSCLQLNIGLGYIQAWFRFYLGLV